VTAETIVINARDRVARDLSAIEDLVVHLESEAIALARDRLMPGGRAMVALAPDADITEWAEQIAYLEFRHYATCPKTNHRRCHVADHVLDEDDQDSEDPLRTLLFWSEAWREERGFPLEGRRPTLVSESSFIRNSLEWAWDNELHFADFAHDVNRTRRSLESLLHAGRNADLTRVRCVACEKAPRLIKVRASRQPVGYSCLICGTDVGNEEHSHCPKSTCWTPLAPKPTRWASDPARDYHKCPSCKKRYDADAFHDAYAKQLRSEGAAKFIPKRDAVHTLRAQGRSERTIRQWFEQGEVETRTSEAGAVLVWWPDLWRLHLVTQLRNRRGA